MHRRGTVSREERAHLGEWNCGTYASRRRVCRVATHWPLFSIAVPRSLDHTWGHNTPFSIRSKTHFDDLHDHTRHVSGHETGTSGAKSTDATFKLAVYCPNKTPPRSAAAARAAAGSASLSAASSAATASAAAAARRACSHRAAFPPGTCLLSLLRCATIAASQAERPTAGGLKKGGAGRAGGSTICRGRWADDDGSRTR